MLMKWAGSQKKNFFLSYQHYHFHRDSRNTTKKIPMYFSLFYLFFPSLTCCIHIIFLFFGYLYVLPIRVLVIGIFNITNWHANCINKKFVYEDEEIILSPLNFCYMRCPSKIFKNLTPCFRSTDIWSWKTLESEMKKIVFINRQNGIYH